jgi:hypothetical protein
MPAQNVDRPGIPAKTKPTGATRTNASARLKSTFTAERSGIAPKPAARPSTTFGPTG